MAAHALAAPLLLLLAVASVHAQYTTGQYGTTGAGTQGTGGAYLSSTSTYPSTTGTYSSTTSTYPSTTGTYPASTSSTGTGSSSYGSGSSSSSSGSSSPLGVGLQGNAGTGIGVVAPSPAAASASSNIAASPGAGLTFTPSTVGTSTGAGGTGYSQLAQGTGTQPGYSSFTPASASPSAYAQAPSSSMGGSGIFGASGSTGTGGTYGAQSRNPYTTSYTPSAVYVGGGAAPAPAPAAAAALTPQAALGPLGPAAITAAQNTTFGETQLSGVGPIYKKQDSLEPFYANLYGIPVPAGQPDPDIFITLETLGGGGADVGLYCNPGWGQYADVNANYPQPGYAVWQSDLSNNVDTVFISKNDRLYRPPYAREPNTTAYKNYQPYFICSVINMDSQRQVSYRLEADLINNNGSLSALEQRALSNIFNSCCTGSAAVCSDWKTRNAKEGKVFTDWCNFPGQICTANGTLMRLDMRGFNLQCPFPASDFAVFTSLTTLNLGRNANMTGSTLELFSALANAKGLRHLNLFRDSGLQGPLAPMLSPSIATICAMAWRSLTTLTADGVQLVGGIPPCLLSNSSKLVELHLGNNNLTGSIPDVIGPASRLNILTLYNNQLTGTIPASIGYAQQLTNLDITGNSIFGTIPALLGNLPNLKYAVLKFNKLSGSIPSSLATNPNLETLDVKGNRLSVLPDEWIVGYPSVVNSSLVNVRFSFNNISGPFPSALSAAPQLTFLVINNNTLSGPLPSTAMGNVSANTTNFFPALRAMNISHNAFTGTLPSAFGESGIFNLKPLQFADGEILMHVFDISYNLLTGKLPSFLEFTNVPEYAQRGIFIAGNNFSYTCGAQQSYINDICLPSSAPAPSRLPPLGTSTSGSRTSTVGLPQTNMTLPTSNSSLPDQLTYPGSTYPSSPISLPGNPSTTNAVSAGNPVAVQRSQPQSGAAGLGAGAIAGIVIGVVLAVLLVGVAGFLAVRNRQGRQLSAKPGGGMGSGLGGSLKMAAGSLKMGGSNKFERFNDGLEMSESTRRMEGFGSSPTR